MINIFPSLLTELAAGRPAALAVVTSTWGSAPRREGSLMLVREDGSFEGSVSGGCVEGTVIAEAQALLSKGEPSKKLEFAVSNGDAFAVGLACGGTIRISIFTLDGDAAPIVAATLAAIKRRESGVLAFSYHDSPPSFGPAPSPKLEQLDDTLSLPVVPRPRLEIIGAVHIAQALAPMATRCGFEVTVIDPRASFIEAREFEGAAIISDWPDEYLSKHPLDGASALVTLTHDPKLDDAALHPALNSPAFYIGSLGSRKTNAARLERLEAAGISQKDLARIHGPVGLNIGSSTPEEIAVSILAEIIQCLRAGEPA